MTPSEPQPLPLPRYTAAQAAMLTGIAALADGVPLRLLDQDGMLFLTAADAPAASDPPMLWLAGDLGPGRCVLEVDARLPERLLHGIDPDASLDGTPAPLLLALLDLALAEASAALQAGLGGTPVRLTAAGNGLHHLRHRFALTITCGPWRHVGRLSVDDGGLTHLARLVARRPHAAPPPPPEMGGLPLRLRLVVGWSDLTAADLRGLEPHDVVLLDSVRLADRHLFVQLAPGYGFDARLDGAHLVFLGQRSLAMTHVPPEEGEPLTSLDELPVRLTFDVGDREMTLGALKALAPGQMIDTGRDLRAAVIIRANGRKIGDGELVQIEDRIGVRILSLPGAEP